MVDEAPHAVPARSALAAECPDAREECTLALGLGLGELGTEAMSGCDAKVSQHGFLTLHPPLHWLRPGRCRPSQPGTSPPLLRAGPKPLWPAPPQSAADPQRGC